MYARRDLLSLFVVLASVMLVGGTIIAAMFARRQGDAGNAQKVGIEIETLEESAARNMAIMRADVADLPPLEAAKYISETNPDARDLILEKANEAVQDNPNSVEALMLRGMALWSFEGDREGARADFTRAVELEPQSGEAHQELARVFCALGEYADSIIEAKKAVELGYPDGHFIQYRAYFAQGEYENALEQLKKGLEDVPDSPARQCIPILESKIKEAAEEKKKDSQ